MGIFVPEILRPTPDPSFVRELRKIDPDLRVVFGYERYFVKQWVIERRLSPERYFTIYASFLESDQPRYVDQPIFDTDRPTYDDDGNVTGYEIVGYNKYDMAPEYEWVMFCNQLNGEVITQLKRTYAWERNHPISRLAFEKAQEQENKAKADAKKRADIALEGVYEGWRQAGKVVQGGQPEKVMEGTVLN